MKKTFSVQMYAPKRKTLARSPHWQMWDASLVSTSTSLKNQSAKWQGILFLGLVQEPSPAGTKASRLPKQRHIPWQHKRKGAAKGH